MSIGLYEDAAKVTPILTSLGEFKTTLNRRDDENNVAYRTTNATLHTAFEWDKYGATILFSNMSESDRDDLRTEYNLRRAIYLFPHVDTVPASFKQVRFVNRSWIERYNQDTDRYSVTIQVEEV